MDNLETKELNTNTMLARLDQVVHAISQLGIALAQLKTGMESVTKSLERLEASVEKLETVNNKLQKSISYLKYNQHRMDAAIAVLSNDLRASSQTGAANSQALNLLNENYGQLNRRLLDVDSKQEKFKADLEIIEQGVLEQRQRWEPWLAAIKWVVIGIASVAVAAIAVWLLRGMAQSILTNGVP